MVKLISKLTANWKRVPQSAKPKLAIPENGTPGEQIVSDPTASQTHVYIGHLGIRRNNPDFYTLLVMDNVLGTGPGFTDRLSANLRDRQGLAYTVNAQIAASAGEEPGTFIGYIGTFPDKYTWVREGFLKEITRIRDEKATAQEVDDAKKFLLGGLPFRTATLQSVAGQLLVAEKDKLGFDFLDRYRTAVDAVTPEMVQAAAKKYLDPKKLTIVAVGPIDKEGKPLPTPKEEPKK
jgi:zinc protease